MPYAGKCHVRWSLKASVAASVTVLLIICGLGLFMDSYSISFDKKDGMWTQKTHMDIFKACRYNRSLQLPKDSTRKACFNLLESGVPVPGSCRGQCNGGRVGNCFCNRHCRRHGDCCHDYRDACVQTVTQRRHQSSLETRGTCSGRCDVGRVSDCFCNQHCQRHGDCCHDYISNCSNNTSNMVIQRRRYLPAVFANASISEVVEAMWSSDTNSVTSSAGLALDYQGRTTLTSERDRARRRLFSNVDENIFRRPTFRRFVQLLDNYDPDVNVREQLTSGERNEIEAFIDAIVATNPMSILPEYLIQRGLLENNINAFKALLRNLWFTLYRRQSRGVVSSSGFEHVMVGEVRGSKVTGFHNWIQFYREEKQGRINYMGFISKQEPAVLRAKFTWRGKIKEGGSMFVGVSPEFDMAVYTLCIMVKPNRDCVFEFLGRTVRVKTLDNTVVPGLQVSSSYVTI